MRVAVLSPIAWRTPPTEYGPWEQVASNITEGLVKRGFEVTLFASGNSITSAKLESVCELPYEEDRTNDPKVLECLHISHLMEQADKYDIIHNHFDFLPLSYSGLIKTPMITTIHGFSSPKIIPVYKKYNSTSAYISISNADRHEELTYLDTIYHGVDPEQFTLVTHKKDYLLYFGRIHPDKGTHRAIEIAKKSGFPLKIAGLIQDQSYFETQVQPHIDDTHVTYLGNVGPVIRDTLLGEAKALLHPISFEEPFGLSVLETMMCGTPVIAFARGSMPELIKENVSGFVVHTISEAVDAVKKLNKINPVKCRAYAVQKFSLDQMITSYIAAYQKVLG
ncbi:glycosyltransferase family 4 protein [Aquimarina sp. ERC-38]|uniref:glycosyltransferase family 4 protein n=1 Tax=Aquimarina sp. ERC-38 TaxID=2949996 RepID=UPI0022472284|nr:glycosyltransferase family 4 protein [Aquimarina sp. ERC-38]UZO80714.1 glycosyltransferase family 4 protein [Aquimarina sp. ERC-38]